MKSYEEYFEKEVLFMGISFFLLFGCFERQFLHHRPVFFELLKQILVPTKRKVRFSLKTYFQAAALD